MKFNNVYLKVSHDEGDGHVRVIARTVKNTQRYAKYGSHSLNSDDYTLGEFLEAMNNEIKQEVAVVELKEVKNALDELKNKRATLPTLSEHAIEYWG